MSETAANPIDAEFAEQRRAALSYVANAQQEAMLDGIEMESFAQAALFMAFKEMIEVYGEEAVAKYAARLPERVLNGEFSIGIVRQ